MKQAVSGRKSSRSRESSISNARRQTGTGFVVCIKNPGYPASLEIGKIYRRLSDQAAEAQGLLRIVDESGEDYLHSGENFLPIELPKAVRDALSIAS